VAPVEAASSRPEMGRRCEPYPGNRARRERRRWTVRAKFQQARILAPAGRSVHESAEVAVEAMQQRLRFRVAEAHVELQHFGSVARQHQTGVEEADEGRAFSFHPVEHGCMTVRTMDSRSAAESRRASE